MQGTSSIAGELSFFHIWTNSDSTTQSISPSLGMRQRTLKHEHIPSYQSELSPPHDTLDDFLKIDKSNSAYSNGFTYTLDSTGMIRQIQVRSFSRQQIEALLTINGNESVTFPKLD